MELLTRAARFIQYLFSKRSEIQELDYHDALLAQVNILIYKNVLDKTPIYVPLNRLRYIHKLERENAQQKLQERIEILTKNKDNILSGKRIEMDRLGQHLPSISSVKVVRDNRGQFYAFEGNGRIAAIRDVFGNQDEIQIEVEEYHVKHNRTIVKKLKYLRRINGLKGSE